MLTLGSQYDLLIHLDAEDIGFVYEWRIEQERELRSRMGSGMTDAEVVKFVNGCRCCGSRVRNLLIDSADMPAYELYVESLRKGIFGVEAGDEECEGPHGNRQLRVVIGRQRNIIQVEAV